MTWIGHDGWPIAYPSELMDALRALPGAERASSEELDASARLIEAVAAGGADEELPRAQVASAATSDRELEELNRLCVKLADHVESMHGPAVLAMSRARVSLFDLSRELRRIAENAEFSYGGTGAPDRVKGRRPDVVAPNVTEIAADVFKEITGEEEPGYTSVPGKSEVSGPWPDFLARVFVAFQIDASASAQVKAYARSRNRK